MARHVIIVGGGVKPSCTFALYGGVAGVPRPERR